MIRLGLHHPKSGYTHWGPKLEPMPTGNLAGWDMREAMGGAAQAVATFMDVPVMKILAEQNKFVIVVKEVTDNDRG